MTEESNVKAPKKQRHWRVVRRTMMGLLLFVTLAVTLLYIPGVLNRVVQWVAPSIEKSAGMRIMAGNVALKFPLHLQVDNLLILDVKATSDTMISARQAKLNVNPMALLGGNLNVEEATITDAVYRMGGTDSLYINARIDSAGLAVITDLAFSKISVDSPEIAGARVDLIMGTHVAEKDSTPGSPLELNLDNVRLRNVLYSMYMGATNDTIYTQIREGYLASGQIIAGDTVNIFSSSIDLAVDSALYGARGAQPLPGLDFSHLLLREVALGIDSFNMHGAELTIPITKLVVKDLAGLSLSAFGTYAMTEEALFARKFDLTINDTSRLLVDAMMGLDSVAPVPLALDVTAGLYTDVVASAFPAAGPLLAPLPEDVPINLRALLSGSMSQVGIDAVSVSMPNVFMVNGSGSAGGFQNPDKLQLNVDLFGRLENARPFASMVPDGINLPPLTLDGNVQANGNDYSAALTATTASGVLALNGELVGHAPDYSLTLTTDSLPIAAFMPDLGVGAVTASVDASGHGFNPLARGATLDVDANVSLLEFNDYNIRDVNLNADLQDGNLSARLNSGSPAVNLQADLDAHLEGEAVAWQLDGNVNHVDLRALGLSDSIMTVSTQLLSDGYASLDFDSICAKIDAHKIALSLGSESYKIDSIAMNARVGAETDMMISGKAMQLVFNSEEPMKTTIQRFTESADLASGMIAARNVAVDSLVDELPQFALDFYANQGSPVQQFLKPSGLNFGSVTLNMHKDSVLTASARVLKLASADDSRLDTVAAALTTRSNRLLLDVNVKNRPGTLDALASVGLRGMVSGNQGKFFLRQQNLQGSTGYKLGFMATVTDSVIGLQITPFDPVIAYRNWSINEDNYIAFNPSTFHLFANLDAKGGGSRIRLLTSETDSLNSGNEVQLKVDDIRLLDWLQINPFAPPIAGNASADMTITYSDKSVSGDGTVSLDSLFYGRKKVGDFNLAMGLATDFGGSIYANVGLDVNGKRTFYALGAVNDTTALSPLNMYMRVKEFPLDIANPFLPSSTAQLSGILNGQMNVSGRFDAIKLNGNLSFSQAKVNVGMMGSAFSLDSVDIPVESNIVKFNDFAILGSNNNPLKVSGEVDLRKFEVPRVNLNLAARNMQFVNSKKGRGVDLFGRGFIDLDASVKGSLSFLNVNANLAILPETNLTYQMSDASVAAGLQPEEGVVRFVNFADTAQVMATDTVASTSMKMMLSALLDVRQGSQFTVNLSADGTNRAHVKGQGILDYAMSPIQPEGRLTGRFTIDDGSFRYSLPVISEKLFTFKRGSYIAFNGDILNPTLGITASDQVRANVTRAGENSRLVNFDVILNASGTPERLDVSFDLSTSDDLTVANELQGMSANQRANQAMNLLLYGVYSGPNSSSGVNLSGNALYGFLASQLNTWAAKSIKGVDLSFGVDQYGSKVDGANSSAMQYSYKVSKSLFNDRFKIVVGGNYSTDDDAEENFAQNLISDVSFEYMLNSSGSMYVRLFRKTGFESILEGEVTQTGAGFVLRRKIRRIADIFNFRKADK